MQSISSLLPSLVPTKSSIRSERASIIKMYLDELNLGRPGYYKDAFGKKKELKVLTARSVAVILSPLKTNAELYTFFSDCRDYQKRYGSFSKRFWGGLKEQSFK